MFIFHRNTKITTEVTTKPVLNAIQMLERDRDKVCLTSKKTSNEIYIKTAEAGMEEEAYRLIVNKDRIVVEAGDNLGFVYGLLYISKEYLKIKPFWFWMDQKIEQTKEIAIPEGTYTSPHYVVRFRGWFFNDEVLMLQWKYNQNGIDGWKMAFEALLRCGGNMTIPGTDKMSRKNRQLAADMGLWITHHHAEPLGAEMFIRAYPELEPNYLEYADKFQRLWEDAVLEQKDMNVVWNLCFRGQGDAPFWNYDTTNQFDTPEKRGKMISDMIRIQCNIVKKHVKHPVFCTNLYGEIMELYENGLLELPQDVIKVRADNGFGKMVTRRRGNHCVRISSMPEASDKGAQGIYYHVSFYDLQAANHITMLPNSISFVDKELHQVLTNGGDDFWVINCSNVRPHTYYLDAVSKEWCGKTLDDAQQSMEFAKDYYDSETEIAKCYESYPNAMIPYGSNEDDHMGEQFYTENIRIIIHQLLTKPDQNAKELYWIAGDKPLMEQIQYICGLCKKGLPSLEALYQTCSQVKKHSLFEATLYLQTKIHFFCAKAVTVFKEAYEFFDKKEYEKAFVLFGNSAEYFDKVDRQMRDSEYSVWKDFYRNDCLADVKHTAYMIRKMMGYVRELGDNVSHDKWYRQYVYAKEDQRVFLLLVTDNHLADWELYQVMKTKVKV